MKQWFLLVIGIWISNIGFSQQLMSKDERDSAFITQLYDLGLFYDDQNVDSILITANKIKPYQQGKFGWLATLYFHRLNGIYYEYKGVVDSATHNYLLTLEYAKKSKNPRYVATSLSDLGTFYANNENYRKACNFYLEALAIQKQFDDSVYWSTTYSNLGAIYNLLEKPDSARQYLELAYSYAEPFLGVDLFSIRNNLGTVYYKKAEYQKSLDWFNKNYFSIEYKQSVYNKWLTHLNLADTYRAFQQLDSAQYHIDKALLFAKQLHSNARHAETFEVLARLKFDQGDYKSAYLYQQKWHQLDSLMVNESNNEKIAELQEKYNAQVREQENVLLTARLQQKELEQQRLYLLVLLVFGIMLLIGIGFLIIQRKNRKLEDVNQLIVKQNYKLAELNSDKNALISVVSHDLGTPFATIKNWLKVIDDNADQSGETTQNALRKIEQSVQRGEQLIRTILAVERDQIRKAAPEFEEVNISAITHHIAQQFMAAIQEKGQQLTTNITPGLFFFTDADYYKRIVENLLSNAIKYSPLQKSIQLEVKQDEDGLLLTIADQGPGIAEEELDQLFSKYGTMKGIHPTGGEHSTGLGLFIVKRLVDELHGEITCQSTVGEGTAFHVKLRP